MCGQTFQSSAVAADQVTSSCGVNYQALLPVTVGYECGTCMQGMRLFVTRRVLCQHFSFAVGSRGKLQRPGDGN